MDKLIQIQINVGFESNLPTYLYDLNEGVFELETVEPESDIDLSDKAIKLQSLGIMNLDHKDRSSIPICVLRLNPKTIREDRSEIDIHNQLTYHPLLFQDPAYKAFDSLFDMRFRHMYRGLRIEDTALLRSDEGILKNIAKYGLDYDPRTMRTTELSMANIEYKPMHYMRPRYISFYGKREVTLANPCSILLVYNGGITYDASNEQISQSNFRVKVDEGNTLRDQLDAVFLIIWDETAPDYTPSFLSN